ncbi:YqiA/YcfP family alpha/beta fold hydrolase [Acinetobacter silvestris]|uniref:Esterase n=1 Tax=Acinetobacter silvestris TaxID=1977882 RepID=A0A1Y3CHD2_9GAMM|nr:YqiA/YcfP family alpha/beta fold hydrolase [Acinetobacter silvestris]OTG65515.1 esterase [Acinetobacter silvestris]
MNSNAFKILFLHGLDSSKESTKFHAINAKNKFCIDIDYRNLNYQTVENFYNEIIEKIKPEMLIGHSLGAYWALKMSHLHRIPAIIANPSLNPNFRDDYQSISEIDLEHDIPQMAYIELGDEILDMHATSTLLEQFMQVDAHEGGHHRLAQPENLNHLIQYMQQTFFRA